MNKGSPYMQQLATIHTWTLCATRLGIPKDIRLLIAQKYLWDDTIPRMDKNQWLYAPYLTETIEGVAREEGLFGLVWRGMAQFLGMLCAGFVSMWIREYLF